MDVEKPVHARATLPPEELEAIRQDFVRACYEAGPMRVLGPKGIALLAHARAITRELEAARASLRTAWEAGFALCRTYSDNWIHWQGEQKERTWQRFLGTLASPPSPPPPGTESPQRRRFEARVDQVSRESVVLCYDKGSVKPRLYCTATTHSAAQDIAGALNNALAAPTPAAATPAPAGEAKERGILSASYVLADAEREAAIDRLIEIEEVFYDADGVACWKGSGAHIAEGWQERLPAPARQDAAAEKGDENRHLCDFCGAVGPPRSKYGRIAVWVCESCEAAEKGAKP